jgi:hypothetical protein
MPEEYVPTAEEIAGHYSAALDSVNLVNELAAKAELTEDEEGTIRRNVEHLELMVAKEFWTNQNMKPLTDAIAAGKAAVA